MSEPRGQWIPVERAALLQRLRRKLGYLLLGQDLHRTVIVKVGDTEMLVKILGVSAGRMSLDGRASIVVANRPDLEAMVTIRNGRYARLEGFEAEVHPN